MRKLLLYMFVIPIFYSASAYAKEPIKVAAIYAMSGEAVAFSYDHLMATRVAIEEINARGGILGCPIQLIEFDNQSTALGSRKSALEAVKQGVNAVVGGPWSSHAIGMGSVLQKAGIPLISPIATNPKVTKIGDYIFRTCFIDSYQGGMLAQFAHGSLQVKTVAVLTNADQVYSIDLSEQFIRKFKALGGKVSVRIDYIENLTQYENLIAELSQHQFDAVMLPGYTRDSAHIIKTARLRGIKEPFIGGDGWSPLMANYALKELNNTYYLTHWHKDLKDKKSADFTNKIKKKLGTDKIMAGMALSYDTIYLLADAIQRAGSAEPKKIRDALAKTSDYVGVTGRIVYDQNRNPIKPAVILKFENGDLVLYKQLVP